MAHKTNTKFTSKFEMFWCFVLLLLKDASAIPEFSVRLHGGVSAFEGLVEVLVNDEWGAIRDAQWDLHDAMVVCRQMGFSTAKNFTVGNQNRSPHQASVVHLQNVVCTGTEKSLSECSYENASLTQEQDAIGNAGVICAVSHSLRLVGGTIPSHGQLQKYLPTSDMWADTCYSNSSWTIQDSLVACRQLGYDRVVSTAGVASHTPEFVHITSNCSGNEFNLHSCVDFTTSVSASCMSGQQLNIQCEGTPSTPNRPQVVRSDCQSLTVNWEEPADNGGHSVSSYVIRYRPVQREYTSWQMVTLTQTQTTLTDLTPGVVYLVSIAASNQVGTSPFSEGTVALTNQPDLSSPEDLTVLETESHSASLGWTAPTSCGIEVSYYELTYHSLASPGLQYMDRALRLTVMSTIVNHTVFLLTPYTTYTLKVRAFGYLNISTNITSVSNLNGVTQPFISAYSSNVTFQTREAAPSASPTSFSAFLQSSSVHFSWGPVPSEFANGIITNYTFSCRRGGETLKYKLSNLTFEHNLTVEGEVQYNCSIAAATEAGTGPQSAPILFFTPPNLNVLPNAPRNVAFAIVTPNGRNSRQEVIVQAQWNLHRCSNNFSCVEVLGYVAVCQDDDGNEVRKIVWQYEVEDDNDGIASTNLSTRPYTQYRCMMASLNRYGLGFFGTIDSLRTSELAPALSPSEIYVTDIQSQEVSLHWSYVEDPPPGELCGFNIRIYYQDPNDPDRVDLTRDPYSDKYELRTAGGARTTFFRRISYFILPATDYVVEISAVTTNGGEGPSARAIFTTSRSVPEVAPSEVTYSIEKYSQPYLFRFSWKLVQPNAISRSMIHSGFTLSCHVTSPSEPEFVEGQAVLNTSMFTSAVKDLYTMDVYLPANCESMVNSYSCSIVAFNDIGVGPSSDNITTYLPCNFRSDLLNNQILTSPYFSIVLLGLLILVIIAALMCCLVFFLFCRRRKRNLTEVEKLYSTVGEMYDENYIRMAPSDSSIKRNWSFTRNHSFSHSRHVPPLPSNRASTAFDGRISTDGTNMENPYDEIPGGKRGKRLGNNTYAEVRRPRDSGVRLSSERTRTPSQQDSHSIRLPTVTPQPSSSTTPNLPSRHTSMIQDDFPPPGSRMNGRRDSLFRGAEGGTAEAGCGTTLHSSPSNTTNLSGNDYVEVTANGELRLLNNKRGETSSSSLDKQASLRRKGSKEVASPVVEETDHQYDNLAARNKPTSPGHHYDNLLSAKGDGSGTKVGVGDNKKERNGEIGKKMAAGEDSEFLEFFDNLDQKKGSLPSLTSDPSYVAMECQHESTKDVTEDSQ